jgi:hypothetical protein
MPLLPLPATWLLQMRTAPDVPLIINMTVSTVLLQNLQLGVQLARYDHHPPTPKSQSSDMFAAATTTLTREPRGEVTIPSSARNRISTIQFTVSLSIFHCIDMSNMGLQIMAAPTID